VIEGTGRSAACARSESSATAWSGSKPSTALISSNPSFTRPAESAQSATWARTSRSPGDAADFFSFHARRTSLSSSAEATIAGSSSRQPSLARYSKRPSE
jgi:hypothetical protein